MPANRALIAGGSGAIGGAVASRVARDGHHVLIGYRSRGVAARAVAESIRAEGGVADVVQLELSDAAGLAQQLGRITAEHSLAGVVYAAGPLVRMVHLSQIDSVEFATQLQADAVGFYNLVHPLIPHLRQQQASVVAVTTAAVSRYSTKDILSVAPKAAVQAIIRGIATEEGRYGIRANCVGVRVLEEGLYDDLVASGAYSKRFLDAARGNAALRRFGSSRDVAEAVAFFIGERSSWVTGQTLNVDGGYALWSSPG